LTPSHNNIQSREKLLIKAKNLQYRSIFQHIASFCAMSEKKLKKQTTLDGKLFMWGVIETDVLSATLLAKKSGSGNKWDSRYVVISRNYIIYYKPVNNDGTPKQFDHCKGVINLANVMSANVRYLHEKPNELIFQVPVPGTSD